MRIGDLEVPPAAIAAWRRILVRSDDSRLTEWASSHNNFITGFRPGKIPGSVIRKKLLALLDQQGAISEPLSSALRTLGISRSIIKVFSEEVITAIVPSLSAYYGDEALAAMLLDDRETVRALGYENLSALANENLTNEKKKNAAEEGENSADIRTAAAQLLTSQLRPFIGDFSQIMLAANPSEDSAAKRERAKDSSEETHTLKEAWSKAESELKRSRSYAEKLLLDCQAKEQELTKVTRSRDAAKEQLLEATKALASLESEFEARVRNAINQQLDERLRPWLKPLIMLEEKSTRLDQVGLQGEVDNILKRQAEVDKQYGTVLKLEEQLSALKSARVRLRSALTGSMKPRREIPALIKRIDLEIEDVESILGKREQPELGVVATEFSREIKLASSLEALAELRTRVIKAQDTGSLQIFESKLLLDLLHGSTDQVYCAASLKGESSRQLSSLAALPRNQFDGLVVNQSRCRLVIDGHNLLFTLEDVFNSFYEDGAPHAQARNELVRRLKILIEQYKTILVDTWFDGPELTSETLQENLRVHFSGGTGANRADDSIVAFLRALKPGELSATFVVTDDRGLRERCSAVGCEVMSCHEVAGLLRR